MVTQRLDPTRQVFNKAYLDSLSLVAIYRVYCRSSVYMIYIYKNEIFLNNFLFATPPTLTKKGNVSQLS